ncbi:hypothetical protein [Nocardia sp. NPDC057353]|uniref:hypothetical protein n=1 Tax=Nocardia sp. NPDC057353 TaxID=3346104 RepID=UPI0036326E6E
MASEAGTILAAEVPIPLVAAAIARSVCEKPSWKERTFEYALVPGIGELWSIERLAPGDPRRLDGGNPAAAYDFIDLTGDGELSVHVAYRPEEVGCAALLLCMGFEPPAGLAYPRKIAQRAADYLAQAGARTEIDDWRP